jgi:formylmethanofuran dehydrogenase subunit E
MDSKMKLTQFPEFFAAAPNIVMHDPLAEFLGASAEGRIEYRYEDAVRLAGHSCPTVASAFLMSRAALRTLFPDSLPVRGRISVAFNTARSHGVTGVIAAVTTLITGATEDSGFQGIGGHFNRRNSLAFEQALTVGDLRFARHDTGAAVEVSARLNTVAADPRVADLLPRCLGGHASVDERKLFCDLWQARVERLLLDHADDPAVIIVNSV